MPMTSAMLRMLADEHLIAECERLHAELAAVTRERDDLLMTVAELNDLVTGYLGEKLDE